jgi:RNA polymerase sigma-70 factor (ECF subfamily)
VEVIMDQLQPDSAGTCNLLERVQQGDRAAFDQLFARHRPALRAFIDRRLDPRVRTRVDPSDVVQETQLDALRGLDDFLERRPMAFRLWLHKAAYQRLLKVHRHHGAQRRAVEREAAWPERSSLLLARRLFTRSPTPSQQLADREVARRVRHALGQLAAADREVLLMRTVEELSYQEIACLLDIESATARKRYGRALLRAQKLLTDEGLLES